MQAPMGEEGASAREVGAAAAAASPTVRGWAARAAANVAVQDWAVMAYFLVLMAGVLLGRGPGWNASLRTLAWDLGIFAAAIVVVRGELVRRESTLASVLYRLVIGFPPAVTYVQLRGILPAITQKALDADIYAFDLRVFHYEPSLAWDKWVSPATVEWFAFFYGLYFLIIAIHIAPFLLFADDSPLFRAYSNGVFVVFLTAHVVYALVPGFGPYAHFTFEHALTGGRFWKLVLDTVHDGGALKDIFPSLHTAAPSFFLFFAIANRKTVPFRYTWPVMAFVVSQIVIATMFLRWHYLVDILAGLALAALAVFLGRAIADWEGPRRARLGAQSVYGLAPLRGLLPKRR